MPNNEDEDEDESLRSVALQNAQAILIARQRAEDDLLRAKAALESKTRELAGSLAMIRATLESTTDGILVTDGDRKVTGYNDKFVQMWRLPRELVDAGDHRRLVATTSRSMLDAQRFLTRIDEIYATSPPETYDLLELADGRVVERFSRIQVVDERNAGRVWSFRDITEQRRSEETLQKQSEWLRVTLASIGDAVITTDEHGNVTSLNPVAENLTGWIQSDAHGRPLNDVFRIVDERTRHPGENPATRALREGRVVGLANHMILIAKDGTERAIDDSAAPIRDDRGNVIGAVLIFRDITGQKQAEQALRESESQLRMVMDHAPVFIARCDKEGRFRFVNRPYAERFGLRPHEIVGKTISEVLGPEADETLGPYIEKVLAGEPVDYEVELNYRRIGKRYVRCSYQPERNLAGQVQGWIAVIGDITEHRRAEEAKALLGAIVESSQDAIVGKSLDGRILSWNAAAEQLFGYTAAEAIGMPITTIIPPDRQDEEISIIERLRRGERIEHYETVRITKDGRRIDVSLTISPLRDQAGRIVGASKIARDITALKRAEQSTRFLADASAALADLSDCDSTLTRIAELAVETIADWCAVDLQSPDGSTRRLVVTHRERGQVREVREGDRDVPLPASNRSGLRDVLRTGEPELAAAFPAEALAELAQNFEPLRQAISPGLHSYICVPLKKARGEVLGALTFVASESGRTYDASDLRMTEDLAHRAVVAIENARLLAALRETDRRKDEFLATLAHELRNPLAPISNALQVMRMSNEVNAAAGELREVMERQVNHLVRLVDDLMEVSRISRGKIELRIEPVDLATVVKTAVEISRPFIDEAGHRLSVSLPSDAIVLNVDQVRLSQVLTNLLTNAAKYMDSGGQIELAVGREGRDAVISVRDTGLGIPSQMLPRVFEMFAQMEHTRRRAQGGLGIGLALAKSLIEMHGGRIEAQSEGLGKGSQFVIRLPLADEGTSQRISDSGTWRKRPLLPRKILVVDDTRAALFVLDKLLTAMGQQVRTAPNAAAAIESARSDPPDIIISDIGMPDTDGYELARQLRKESSLKDVVLVALTGYGQVNDRQRAKDAGFDHHLVKPVDYDVLHALLSILGRRTGP